MQFDKADLARIQRKIESVSIKKQSSTLVKAFRDAAIVVEGALKRNLKGPILNSMTGHLSNSIESKIEKKSDEIEALIGSGVRTGIRLPYANIHEYGDTIRPKKAKALYIPELANTTRRGVMRMSPRAVYEAGGFKIGNAVFLRQGKGLVRMFTLKQSVRIRARHYLSVTAAQSKDKTVAAIETAIEKALETTK